MYEEHLAVGVVERYTSASDSFALLVQFAPYSEEDTRFRLPVLWLLEDYPGNAGVVWLTDIGKFFRFVFIGFS